MYDQVKIIILMLILSLSLTPLTIAGDCPAGDLHPDCKIDIQDLLVFALQWLDTSCSGPACGDLTGDHGVNNADFAILANNWLLQEFPLVINEFMAKNDTFVQDPTGDNDDWIEIFNYSGASVDIAGMYITDSPSSPDEWYQIPFGFPEQTTIPPNGFLVIWADEDVDPSRPLHASFKLGASGDTISLKDPAGITVDTITYSTAQNADESLGRFPDGAGNWQNFTTATIDPSPGQSNGSPTIDIVINEIMYHPSSELDAEEYIELYNNGNAPINLTGWQFSEGVDYTFGNVTIDSGEYLVVAANVSDFTAKYPAVTNVVGGWIGKLSNNSEDIELLNKLGVRIDRLDYADQGDWCVRQLGIGVHRGWQWSDDHDGGGKSLELINADLENGYGQNWKASITYQGTPGLANSVAAGNVAPVILDVKHYPRIPNSTDAVTVTARVIDELSAINTVTLYYRIDTSVYMTNEYPSYDPADYTTVTMYDDGFHGDGPAGDGVYGAAIEPQSNMTITEFFVKADDKSTNSRTWPAPSDVDGTPEQVTNLLYQVDNSFDASAKRQGGSQPFYRIIMTQAENDRLKDIGDGRGGETGSNAQMNATFISIDGVDTKTRYNVGVRNRGQSSRRGPPNNYRVNFVHDNKWKKVSAVNINNRYSYSQVIGCAVFQMAGLTAPNAQDIQLRVNGENIAESGNLMYGSYVLIEAFGGDFVENHFPDDKNGNLYKAQAYCGDCGRPTPWIAGLYYEGIDPADYTAAGYYKDTNQEYNDWNDLINLTNVLENAPDETYSTLVQEAVDVDQWVRWFAVNNLIGNNETSLGTGRGDDYRFYIGINDPRAKLVVHDMDTVLGLGDWPNDAKDPIFRAADPTHLPVIKRFLEHPDFAPLYYAQLKELSETVFSPEQFDPVIEKVLSGIVPPSVLYGVKQFAVKRVANVLAQIPMELTATSSLELSDGLYRTTTNTGQLLGYSNAIDTRGVTVNGLPATWSAKDAQWTFDIAASGLTLYPGINRLKVQSYATANATSDELEHKFIDIWYDTGSKTIFSGGTLTSNTTFDLASSPWHVTNAITVPAGVTLTIEPAATVYFDSGAGITVNGRLVAEGTEFQRIRLSHVPDSGVSWDGLIFDNSLNDSRLAHIDMSDGDARGNSIEIEYSQLLLDNMTWPGSTKQAIEMNHPSLIAKNCIFQGADGEVIHGTYIEGDEYLTFKNNIFERGHGSGDIIDFLGAKRPGPVFKLINNIFMGGPDDGIDLDGADAHIEGNIFMDFHKETTRNTTSNCIATGLPQTGEDYRSEITVARNVFYGSDHAILLKEESFASIENNVFVGMSVAAIQFNETGGTGNMGPSSGGDIDGNIFFANADLFKNQFSPDIGQWPDPMIAVNNSIIDSSMHYLGTGNIDVDPSFIDNNKDFRLMVKSAGIGSGPNLRNMGAFPTAGATVSGEPGPITNFTTAMLTVDGPGISHYQYRLKENGIFNGNWSAEHTIHTPITLTGLVDGRSYTVYTRGRSIDHVSPGDPEGNPSRTWTVDTSFSKLMINEVLAHSHGNDPDILELYCEGTSSFDMTDMSITDDPAEPRKYVFPAGTTIDPGQFLVYYLSLDPAHLGFSLYSNGEGLYLYDKPSNGGGLIDSVEFGIQLNGISIGRVGWAKEWKLTYQTFGIANKVCPLDNPKNIKINEWLANGKVLFEDDFIELYNPGKQPVDISGFYISDNATAKPTKHRFADLSFIPPKGYVYLFADDDESEGADHLNFNLSSDQETITLMDENLNVIDKVIFLSQTTDVSEGRSPDGSNNFIFFDLPTPGIKNKTFVKDVTTSIDNIFPIDASWSYYQDGAADAGWMDIDFADADWDEGPALLYYESASLPAPKNTHLDRGPSGNRTRAFYFRRHFNIDDLTLVKELQASIVIDDGAVFYINGVEVLRHGMAQGITIEYGTLANRTVGNAVFETITIPEDALVEGDNVIAVEVHQRTASSSDIVFGMSLDAVNVTTTITDINPYLDDEKVLDSLRITEIMYNPPGDDNLEYIKLKNIGDETIDITDVRFVDGIDYQFPSMTLTPGQYIVIAADKALFEAQYPGINAVGQYAGKLSNSGERIVLTLANPPLQAAILRFDYNNTWYPSTDGGGSSLEIIDPTADPALWNNAESWQAGTSP